MTTISSANLRAMITATLSVRDWERAVDFYKAAFGAVALFRVPGGGVAQLAVNGAEFWVAEESPAHQSFSPQSLGGCSVRMLLIVADPAAVCARAVAAGATQVRPVTRRARLAHRPNRRSRRPPLGDRPTVNLRCREYTTPRPLRGRG